MSKRKSKQTADMARPKRRRFLGVFYNTKPTIFLLLAPIGVGLFTISLIASGLYYNALADIGSKRLVTPNWQAARDTLKDAQPEYQRKFTYYRLENGQTLESTAAFFGVSPDILRQLNPGRIVAGTTIKIPPVQQPLSPTGGANGQIGSAEINHDHDLLHIKQKYDKNQPVVTTIPELMDALPKGTITQTGPKRYRLNQALVIQDDIRLDMTPATITKLEIVSKPGSSICLCFDKSAVLMNGVEITTYDPRTAQPDENYKDGRSFVRMKSGRMDIINSRLHHLGTSLESQDGDKKPDPAEREGGMYGVSWRIGSTSLGRETTTGWVEGSTFDHNHFGAYTLGASGMMWRGNVFADNDVYGLDPHDDSNNALIENNAFYHNGKHGFIMSVRCNFNVIRGNLSVDNAVNGYMLHNDSSYNLVENNIAYGNTDNFVVYDSHFNTIRGNMSYLPRSSHVRINQNSANTFVMHNHMEGGPRGVYLYDGAKNALIEYNAIHETDEVLGTDGAANVLFADNMIDRISYDIAPGDRMIYGTNTIKPGDSMIPDMASMLQSNAAYRARIGI